MNEMREQLKHTCKEPLQADRCPDFVHATLSLDDSAVGLGGAKTDFPRFATVWCPKVEVPGLSVAT